MHKKVLFLGGGPLQVPALAKTKALGYYVICLDYDKNAPGSKLADKFETISTIDTDAVLEIAKKERVAYVITSASDAPVRTAAYVSEKLKLPTGISFNAAIRATYKDAMRKCLDEANLPIPEYRIAKSRDEFETALQYFDYNCIIKPADSSASRGVLLLQGNQSVDVTSLYQDEMGYSKRGVLMIEEHLRGPEVSVEAITLNGETNIIAITDKLTTEPPYFVELGHSEPSSLPTKTKREIELITKKVVSAIGITNGPSHTEIMITEDGPKIIETAARLGGDYITAKLVPLSTGINMIDASIDLALSGAANIPKLQSRGAAIRFITSSSGTIKSITVDDAARTHPNLEEIKLYKKAGEHIHSPKSSNDRIGHVICSADDAKTASKAADEILDGITVCIAEDKSDPS